jgi:hypothetical protein
MSDTVCSFLEYHQKNLLAQIAFIGFAGIEEMIQYEDSPL